MSTSSTNNYFSVAGEPVFFDDFEERSISRAWDEALRLQAELTRVNPYTGDKHVPVIAIYRDALHDGPWKLRRAPIINDNAGPRCRPRAHAPIAA